MKNKIIYILNIILILSMLTLTGCRRTLGDPNKIQVVCTTYPIYDWAREIIGEDNENVELTLLLKNGVDMHSFQPSTEDVAVVASCDVLIYVGGESDAWVDDVLKESINDDMVVLNLLDCLGEHKKLEEHKEGMEGEAEDDAEYDEHVWLSLKNALVFVEVIKDTMVALDDEGRDIYEKRYNDYKKELTELDNEYQSVVDNANKNTIIVADRFPFLYLTSDYGLDYYAAFSGCSSETDASFETVVFLADKLDEIGASYILIIDNSDSSLAETVIDTSDSKGADVLVLDSLQSVTKKDIENGKTYLSVMKDNLQIIKKALE